MNTGDRARKRASSPVRDSPGSSSARRAVVCVVGPARQQTIKIYYCCSLVSAGRLLIGEQINNGLTGRFGRPNWASQRSGKQAASGCSFAFPLLLGGFSKSGNLAAVGFAARAKPTAARQAGGQDSSAHSLVHFCQVNRRWFDSKSCCCCCQFGCKRSAEFGRSNSTRRFCACSLAREVQTSERAAERQSRADKPAGYCCSRPINQSINAAHLIARSLARLLIAGSWSLVANELLGSERANSYR